MRIGSKRWNDPVDDDDGTRILVCRYRPRGVSKANETWSEWHRELAPSEALHAAYYGKFDVSITFDQYRTKFLDEMRSQRDALEQLAKRVGRGERVTLLCSSACTDPKKCHRTLVIGLVEELVAHSTSAGKIAAR